MTEAELKRNVIALRIFFLIPGLVLLVVGLSWAWQGAQAKGWHKVQGFILSIEEKTRGSRGGIVTGVRVRYSYDYSGAVYEASRICFGMSNIRILDRIQYLPIKNQVAVWVNPEKPEHSVLIPGVDGSAIFVTVFGSLLIAFALFVFRPKFVG